MQTCGCTNLNHKVIKVACESEFTDRSCCYSQHANTTPPRHELTAVSCGVPPKERAASECG